MDRLRNFKFQKVKNGNSVDVPDFFEKIIKPQFANVDTIKRIHEALMSYIELRDATFFLRLYGSYPREKYGLLRRGFLTEYSDGRKIAFCDNTFSMMFTGLKIANIPFDKYELKAYLNQKNLVTSFGLTSKEKELCYYSPQGAIKVNLNSLGWYLAHVKPVGFGFKNLDLKEQFPNPDRSEWDEKNRKRYVDSKLSSDQEKIIRAHFLRLIHPLNSFLLPKRTLIKYHSGNNLGEEMELLKHVKDFVSVKFRSEYEEFYKASIPFQLPNPNTKITNIEWGHFSKRDKSVQSEIKPDIKLKRTNISLGVNGSDEVNYVVYSRLNFSRDFIEPLKPSDEFTIHLKSNNLTYRMTKQEFYETFDNVIKSDSYKIKGSYSYTAPPLKIEKYIVDSGDRNFTEISDKFLTNRGIDSRTFNNTQIQLLIVEKAKKMSINELDELLDENYSKRHFNNNYPIFIKYPETLSSELLKKVVKDKKGNNRWTTKYRFVRNGYVYLVTTQWYARNDEYVRKWLLKN